MLLYLKVYLYPVEVDHNTSFCPTRNIPHLYIIINNQIHLLAKELLGAVY